eukprot:EG_transcript_11197
MAQRYDMIANVRYIPLRLSPEERRQFHLLLAALHVSEYVDHVDVVKYQRQDLIVSELRDLYHIIWGLHIASGAREMKLAEEDGGAAKVEAKPADVNLVENAQYFASLFEVGRRYKIMNPDKMRSEYGKLLYLMQDACSAEAVRALGFRPYKSIVTVHSVLSELELLDVLTDPRLPRATTPTDSECPAEELEQFKREKEELIRAICQDHVPNNADPKREALERCIRSIDDAYCYVRDNVCTIDQAISYLQHYFPEEENPDKLTSLAIQSGVNGSCLTHRHGTQYTFVLQSLTLWKIVQLHLFRLWHTVEEDMLDQKCRYRYQYTGQGYHRVQPGPRIHAEMSKVLQEALREVGRPWVGLSVVHLGDNDVPNALNFIDKYTQVPRIVNPIVKCIQGIDEIVRWPGILQWVDAAFGTADDLKKCILRDFFRHGFDGSGDDGGSCIDGRLTSAWNWCQQLGRKRYAAMFRLTGFSSFDGTF